jgi:hypothetical protein
VLRVICCRESRISSSYSDALSAAGHDWTALQHLDSRQHAHRVASFGFVMRARKIVPLAVSLRIGHRRERCRSVW